MVKYYDIKTQQEIEAVKFEKGNIDCFLEFVCQECSEIDIRNYKCANLSFPFGYILHLTVLEGDYLVKGYEIPGTIPKMHEFHVMSESEFLKRYYVLDSGSIGEDD